METNGVDVKALAKEVRKQLADQKKERTKQLIKGSMSKFNEGLSVASKSRGRRCSKCGSKRTRTKHIGGGVSEILCAECGELQATIYPVGDTL